MDGPAAVEASYLGESIIEKESGFDTGVGNTGVDEALSATDLTHDVISKEQAIHILSDDNGVLDLEVFIV